jgi:hypothetical protein
MLPNLRPASVVAPHHELMLSDYLFTQPVKLSRSDLVAARKEEDRKREYERSRILTLPFRQISYWMWRGFMIVKSIIWKDDFIYMQVAGKTGSFKIGKSAAWALDDGRALDRLVKHRLTDS